MRSFTYNRLEIEEKIVEAVCNLLGQAADNGRLADVYVRGVLDLARKVAIAVGVPWLQVLARVRELLCYRRASVAVRAVRRYEDN